MLQTESPELLIRLRREGDPLSLIGESSAAKPMVDSSQPTRWDNPFEVLSQVGYLPGTQLPVYPDRGGLVKFTAKDNEAAHLPFANNDLLLA